nr:uncharacterized protein LOC129387234 isoform X4 [Dermacentor andersoni]
MHHYYFHRTNFLLGTCATTPQCGRTRPGARRPGFCGGVRCSGSAGFVPAFSIFHCCMVQGSCVANSLAPVKGLHAHCRRIFLLARSSSLVGSGHSGYNEQQHAARSQRDPHVVDWGYDRHRCLSKNDQCHSGEAYLS